MKYSFLEVLPNLNKSISLREIDEKNAVFGVMGNKD